MNLTPEALMKPQNPSQPPLKNWQIAQDRRNLASRSVKEAARNTSRVDASKLPQVQSFNRLNKFIRDPTSLPNAPTTLKTSSVPFSHNTGWKSPNAY